MSAQVRTRLRSEIKFGLIRLLLVKDNTFIGQLFWSHALCSWKLLHNPNNPDKDLAAYELTATTSEVCLHTCRMHDASPPFIWFFVSAVAMQAKAAPRERKQQASDEDMEA